jgi:tRNA A-37 threonylcarbamoyl transferase component Bud32
MSMTTETPLPIDDLPALRRLLSARAPVRPIAWQGRSAYGKRRVALRVHERALLGLSPLVRRWLARDLAFEPMRYRRDLPVEVQRLRALRALGWNVPEVLATEEEVFVTADAGTTLSDLLAAENDADTRRQWLRDAACDLAAFHAAGQWHGAAQIRNVVRSRDGRLGRIDFETALDQHLPLALLQAFDAALYFTSIVRTRDRDVLPEVAQAYLDAAPEPARAALRRGLPLLRRLARSRLLQKLAPKEADRLRAVAALPLD